MTTPATSSETTIGIIKESVFGTTPATPAFLYLRATGSTLTPAKDVFTSAELRADRNISDVRHGALKPAGDIDFQLEYDATLEEIFAGVLCGAWSGAGAAATLVNGTTRASYTIERKIGPNLYAQFVGCEFNTLAIDITPGGIVTGKLGVMARAATLATASLGTTGDASTTAPFDAFSGTIDEGGSSIAIVSALSINIDNGMEARPVLGDNKSLEYKIGMATVTASLTAYLEDWTLASKFTAETESSAEFTLTDGTNTYTFNLPRTKYTGMDLQAQGGNDITPALPFQALYDSATAGSIKITR